MYTSQTYTLRWPIILEEKTIESVQINLINHAQHKEVLKSDPDEMEAFPKFIMLATGLTDAEVKKIKGPDFNSLRLKISDIVSKPTSHFIDNIDLDKPQLLQPFTGEDGQVRESLDIDIPDVAAIQRMHKLSSQDKEKATLWISMQCTGLTEKDIETMSVPDYNQLQERLGSFLNESADSFQ